MPVFLSGTKLFLLVVVVVGALDEGASEIPFLAFFADGLEDVDAATEGGAEGLGAAWYMSFPFGRVRAGRPAYRLMVLICSGSLYILRFFLRRQL